MRVCVRMEIGRDIIRRVNGLGDFGQRTFWVVTEETPVNSVVFLATHNWSENEQAGSVGRLLYCTV